MTEFTKEKLTAMTAKELRNTAKEFDIAGRWDMTKEQLVNAIVEAKNVSVVKTQTETQIETAKEAESAETEKTIDTVAEEGRAADKDEKNAAADPRKSRYSDEERRRHNEEVRLRYLQTIEKGTIVAFKITVEGETKVKSAAVENRSNSKQLLKLQNKVGTEFIVPFSDILWVRSGARWPVSIYELLKGMRKYGEECKA